MEKRKSIFKLSRGQWISVAVLASSLGVAGAVTIPNTFTAGTTISAAQVNANFNALATTQPAAKTFQTTSASFPGTEGDLKTFSVTTPGAGQVMITMGGYVRIAHATGTGSAVSLFVRQGATKYRVVTEFVPSIYPSANPTIHTFSFTAAFAVASAGAYDIIVSGLSNVGADWGDCGPVVQGCPVVTLQYLPATLP